MMMLITGAATLAPCDIGTCLPNLTSIAAFPLDEDACVLLTPEFHAQFTRLRKILAIYLGDSMNTVVHVQRVAGDPRRIVRG